jgi:ankyrin repeat protein
MNQYVANAALHKAAREGEAEAARRSLEQGADPSSFDDFGMTALMAAAERGWDAVVEALLQADPKGASTRALGTVMGSKTALMFAASHGRSACVELLLAADPSQALERGPRGQTALMMAAQAPRGSAAVAALLKVGDPSARDRDGRGALFHACGRSVDPRSVELLMEAGSFAVHDAEGEAVSGWAAEVGDAHALGVFLKRDPELGRGEAGAEALRRAASRGRDACVELLLPMATAQSMERAWMRALSGGFERLGGRIRAFGLARQELMELSQATPTPARGKASAL